MLKLNLQVAPKWIDLGRGVEVEVLPMDTEIRLIAANAIGPREDGETVSPKRSLAWAKAVAREAIVNWRGVGDADGAPIAVSPEGVDALLDDFGCYVAFQIEYLNPGLLAAAEGNGSAPAPNGTSEAGGNTAGPASPAARTARPK
jgi:hypothetical protein